MVFPDRDILRDWVNLLHEQPSFLRNHLPEMDERWIEEIGSIIDRVRFPYFKDDIHHKAAHIFYKVIKNHTLSDGNKRSAVIVLYIVYLLNDYILMTRPMALRSLARSVASDKLILNPKIKNPEAVVSILEVIFSQITHLIQPK